MAGYPDVYGCGELVPACGGATRHLHKHLQRANATVAAIHGRNEQQPQLGVLPQHIFDQKFIILSGWRSSTHPLLDALEQS